MTDAAVGELWPVAKDDAAAGSVVETASAAAGKSLGCEAGIPACLADSDAPAAPECAAVCFGSRPALKAADKVLFTGLMGSADRAVDPAFRARFEPTGSTESFVAPVTALTPGDAGPVDASAVEVLSLGTGSD